MSQWWQQHTYSVPAVNARNHAAVPSTDQVVYAKSNLHLHLHLLLLLFREEKGCTFTADCQRCVCVK